MAYDEGLAQRLRELFANHQHIVEKKMFGGLAFMLNGNMCCGVVGDTLMARVGLEQYSAALQLPYAREMDFTGRAMKGFIYAEKYFHLEMYDRYLERFANRIESRDASVLDVACGPGNVSAYLAKVRPDLKLVGIDLAEGMIKQAKLRVPSAKFLVKDCRFITELDQVFAASAFAFGLNYLTDDDANQFFSSLNSTLADSAMLYLSTITGEPTWSGFEVSSSGDRVYLVYRRVRDVVSMVERAGYRVDYMEVITSPANAPKATQDLILIAQRTENVHGA